MLKNKIQIFLKRFRDEALPFYYDQIGWQGLPKEYWQQALSDKNIDNIASSFSKAAGNSKSLENFFDSLDPYAVASLMYGESTFGKTAKTNPLQIKKSLLQDITNIGFYRKLTEATVGTADIKELQNLLNKNECTPEEFSKIIALSLTGLYTKWKILDYYGVIPNKPKEEIKPYLNLFLMNSWHRADIKVYKNIAAKLKQTNPSPELYKEAAKQLDFSEGKWFHNGPAAYALTLSLKGKPNIAQNLFQNPTISEAFKKQLSKQITKPEMLKQIQSLPLPQSKIPEAQKVAFLETDIPDSTLQTSTNLENISEDFFNTEKTTTQTGASAEIPEAIPETTSITTPTQTTTEIISPKSEINTSLPEITPTQTTTTQTEKPPSKGEPEKPKPHRLMMPYVLGQEPTDDFLAGFKEGGSLGWIKNEDPFLTFSHKYLVGRALGSITSNIGIALISGALANSIDGLITSSRILAPLTKRFIAKKAIDGLVQGGSYLLVNNLLSSNEYDIKAKDVPYVLLDFTTGEIARGGVSKALSKLKVGAITKQLLSSLSDYLVGAFAAASSEYAATGDINTFAENLGPQAIAGFAVENLLWGFSYSKALRHYKQDLNDVGAQLKASYENYLKNPTEDNWKVLQKDLDITMSKLTLLAGGEDNAKVLLRDIMSEKTKMILEDYYKNLGVDIPVPVRQYLESTNKPDINHLIHLWKTAENKAEVKEKEPVTIKPEPQKATPELLQKAFENVNLQAIKGIGETKYKRLKEYLETGKITSLEDIDKIPYLGDKTKKQVKNLIKQEIDKYLQKVPPKTTPQFSKEFLEKFVFNHPKKIIIGDKKVSLDFGDPVVEDIIKLQQLKETLGHIKDPEIKAQAEEYIVKAGQDIAKQTGLDEKQFWEMADRLKKHYDTTVKELKEQIPKTEDLTKLEQKVNDKFVIGTRKIFQDFFKETLKERIDKIFVGPSERLKDFDLKPEDFTKDLENVKEPINLTRMFADDDVKRLIYKIAEKVDEKIPRESLADISEKAVEIAQTLGFKQEDVEALKHLMATAPELTVALRDLIVKTSKKTYDIAKQIAEEYSQTGEVSAARIGEFYSALQLVYALTNNLKHINRYASYVLNAGRITVDGETKFLFDLDDPEILNMLNEEFIAKGFDTEVQAKKAFELAQKILSEKNAAAVVDVARKQYSTKQKFWKALLEFRVANILSFGTHVRNVVSQSLNTMYDMTVEGLKWVFANVKGDKVTAKKAGFRLLGMIEGVKSIFTTPLVSRKEIFEAAYGHVPSFWELLKLRLFQPKLYEKMMHSLDVRTKASVEGFHAALDSDFLGLTSDKPLIGALIKFGDWAAANLRLFTYGGLSLGDRPFKRIYYEGGLKATLAELKAENPKLDIKTLEDQVVKYRKAVQLYQGLRQLYPDLPHEEIVKRIVKIIGENPFEYKNINQIKQIDAQALEEAAKGTWQDPLDTNILKAIERVINSTPALKFLVPFTHTPSRILEKYLYGTGLHKKFWADLLGKNGPEAKLHATASFMVTSLLYLLGYSLYKNGILIPPAKDAEEEKTLRQYGVEPASIKIGNKFISFTTFDPYPSYVFTAIGSLVRIADELDQYTDDQRTLDKWFQAFSDLLSMNLKAVTDKTYFKSLGEVLDFIRGINTSRLPKSLGTSLVPGYGMYKSLRYSDVFGFNPFKQSQVTWFKKEGKSYPRVDIFGEPVDVWGSILGARTLKLTEDPVKQELLRLYLVNKFKLSGFGKTAFGVPITEAEQYKLYSYMKQFRAKDYIQALINSPGYKNLSDEDKAAALQKLWLRLKRRARMQLLRDMEFRELMQNYKEQYKQSHSLTLQPFVKLLETQLETRLGR